MYSNIINPLNNKSVSIYTPLGIKIIQNYIKTINGGFRRKKQIYNDKHSRILTRGLRRIDNKSDKIKSFLKQKILIFSDIDDTIICSKGKMFKGIDNSCIGIDQNDFYPDIGLFYNKILKGPNKIIALLSARLFGFRGIKKTIEQNPQFEKYNIKIGPILPGCYTSVTKLFNNPSLGECKFIRLKQFIINNIKKIKKGNKKIIFIGDNGQGDEYTAKRLLEDTFTRPFIKHIYIHNVRNKNSQSIFDLNLFLPIWTHNKFPINRKSFTYFNTYNEIL